MKKKKLRAVLLACVLIVATVVSLAACTGKTLKLENFAEVLASAQQPYDVVISTKVGELVATSHLQIGKNGEVTVAKKTSSVQSYNLIVTGNEEKIGTTNTTEYFDGARHGTEQGGQIVWVDGALTLPKVPNIPLNADVFANEPSIAPKDTSAVLTVMIKDEKAEAIFGEAGMSNINLVVTVEVATKRVTSINITYLKGGKNCSIDSTYGYDLQTVVLP